MEVLRKTRVIKVAKRPLNSRDQKACRRGKDQSQDVVFITPNWSLDVNNIWSREKGNRDPTNVMKDKIAVFMNDWEESYKESKDYQKCVEDE